MSDTPVIEVDNLTKTYREGRRGKEVQALRGVSFDVRPGEVFGLIGPNGAGKTTFIKVILGIAKRSGGEAKLFGQPVGDRKLRQRIGYLPEQLRIPRHHTARTALEFYGELSGMSRKAIHQRGDALLDEVGLEEWKTVPIKKYSKGMLQRLGLAQAMLHEPDLLILDEPTDGLDPLGRSQVRDLINKMKAEGKTIFLNSHLLAELEMVCDRVAILKAGGLEYIGKVGDVSTRVESETDKIALQLLLNGPTATIRKVLASSNVEAWPSSNTMPWQLNLQLVNQTKVDAMIDSLRKAGISIIGLNRQRVTLEDAFLDIVQSSPEK